MSIPDSSVRSQVVAYTSEGPSPKKEAMSLDPTLEIDEKVKGWIETGNKGLIRKMHPFFQAEARALALAMHARLPTLTTP